MNKRVILIGLISLVVSGHIAKAQETIKLSLEDAEKYAIEHNRTMQNASLDIQQAKATRWQTLSSMLPQVSAGFSYQNHCGYELNMMGVNIPMNPNGTFNTTVSMALTGAQVVGTMLANLSIEMADITKPILLDEPGQEMIRAILEVKAAIQSQGGGGITPSGTLNITENGEYDVTAYASVIVNITYPNGDEVGY